MNADERIAEIEKDLSFEATLMAKKKQKAHAEQLLAAFDKGNLDYTSYKKLPKEVQALYKSMFGKRPKTPNEIKAKENLKKKRRSRNKLQKASRKTNNG